MEKELLVKLDQNFQDYRQKLLQAMKEYSYRFKRYDVDYTVALYALSTPVDISFVENKIRKSDKAVLLDDGLIAILFDFVDAEGGLKASENILTELEPKMFGKKIFVSIVNSKDAQTKEEHIRKLFDLLRYEIKNDMTDIPLTI
ncbi:MAG: hypothetical protein GXO11_00610 [Epsilonproteobacteria bacterium]|nr:hypothetical protein [Campylobacterota bacterium]